ncbi:MAG: CHAT domain-containing protein [Chloroflexota bacterium]|nr:CHAT domain-containing protein [Chloroflexota bacterium]
MPTPANNPVDDDWLDALLRLASVDQQASFLQAAGWLNENGLSQLLGLAMTLARSDPGKARQLTTLCADLAERVDAPHLIPRATYLRAQTHAINGELNIALQLTKAARSGYEALGEQLEALRTNVGLMRVLNELGRHREALHAGDSVLRALTTADSPLGEPEEVTLLVALVNQNRGVCYETIGRYDAALDAYAAAEDAYTILEMKERISDIRNNRGIVLTHLGRVSEALEAFKMAVVIREEAGLTLLQAQTLSNIGEAHLLLGNYTRSLHSFEEARRLFDSLDARAHQHILLRKTADAYLVLNLYPEAVSAYREAVESLEDAGMADHRARALWGFGSALLALSRLEEAEAALSQAAQLFAAADNVPMLCSVMLEQAAVQRARGDSEGACKTAQQALELVGGQEWPVQQIYASMRVADLLLPNASVAERYLLAVAPLVSDLRLPQIQYRFNRRMGHLRLLQEQEEEARSYLEEAVTQIEGLRGTLAQEALRTSFLQDKTAAYEELMQLYLSHNGEADVARAFAIAEQAKSRTLVDLLTGVIEGAGSTPDDQALAYQLQVLQADLNAVYNQFLQGDGRGGERSLAELHDRAVTLEQQIRRLQLKAMGRVDIRDRLATPLSLEMLQDQLPPDLSLLAYHIMGNEILAFVSHLGRIQVVREVSQVSVVQRLLQRLSIQWDRFRADRDFAQRNMVVLLQSTERVLSNLYDELVAPLIPLLNGGVDSNVVIVPHGVLHQVPFHALYDGREYLIDRWEISYAPSATVFALCQQRRRYDMSRGLVVGVPDELIPAVATETRLVSQQLGESGVHTQQLVGERATPVALRSATTRCDLLHFACHGLFRADNPMFSALKLHNRWLTAADVMQLKLDDALVTLSACESGRSHVIMGDEVIGLPRAFLGAGAATLVVSLWLVQDETTARLMADLYDRLCHQIPPATALRAAQRALKEQSPHPYYWAPFLLIGKR